MPRTEPHPVAPTTIAARRHGIPVPVRVRDGAPEVFRWRGRSYRVQSVLARWSRVGPWWAGASVSSLLAGDAELPAAEARRSVLADDEREHWRVEACRDGARAGIVVELSHALATGGWTLTGVLD